MVTEIVTPRIAPLGAPYRPEIGDQLSKMMPPGVPPIALFRTFVRNLPMTEAMHGWGSYELSRSLSLSMRDREIVIDRTCARCGCEYEWGVHVVLFAERAGLDQHQIASLTAGTAGWYHAISFVARAARVSLEVGASTFEGLLTQHALHGGRTV
jgi:hypothetical protein